MKISSLPWLIVPGMGQIRAGASGRGVLLFTLFAFALNGCLLSALLSPWAGLTLGLGITGAALWLVSAADGLRLFAKRRDETS
jgi:hypothetical protein